VPLSLARQKRTGLGPHRARPSRRRRHRKGLGGWHSATKKADRFGSAPRSSISSASAPEGSGRLALGSQESGQVWVRARPSRRRRHLGLGNLRPALKESGQGPLRVRPFCRSLHLAGLGYSRPALGKADRFRHAWHTSISSTLTPQWPERLAQPPKSGQVWVRTPGGMSPSSYEGAWGGYVRSSGCAMRVHCSCGWKSHPRSSVDEPR
jgi:hypothetical protein